MQPEILELTGFTGIQSGLGKETLRLDLRDIPSTAKLVAFTGPNGIGKSTIMDNLQPYRTMPSRSTTLGPGGFSYWDNICAPTAKKELHWCHNSERFRSTLVFKVSGRTKKAEAYLARWSALSDEWAPVSLPDGTLSDGKSETVSAKIETLRSTKHEAEKSHAKAEYLADEIAKWKLIEKGFGNNGLIALSIDDAGPEISSLCNGLLQECYGGRFSVRLDTQSETAAGNLRETFDVRVSDNHRGEEKSLFIMSGGERVWVNECLARAMSLYIDISKGSAEQTLFSDEADGPLDPDRKRQFMQMKRAVLSKGNYSREYFITQTPELWEEADHIIDVATL